MKNFRNIILGTICLASVFGCAKNENTIVVGATATPHAEILEQVKPLLKEEGYELDIKVFSDYVLPNTALEDGELDANYFQHITYLNEFNTSHNTHLVSVGNVHYEPFGLYAGSKNNLDNIALGDKILVPNDATNEARALLLLEQEGLISLKDDAGINATKLDIEDNPYNLEIVEIAAEQIPNLRDEGAFAVINGNYAIGAGLSVSDALAVESSEGTAAQAYANVLAVKEGNQENEKILALYEALTSDTIKNYIESTYAGSVVALF